MDLDKKEHQNMSQVTQQTLLSHPDFISFLCVTKEDPGYYTYYHSKTHSMTIMTIWTFEKGAGYNIKQL